MALMNRQTLKNYFKKGNSPDEMHFAHLIDSMVNIVEDGIGRGVDDGFRISPQGYSKKLISFFENPRNTTPSWYISLNESNQKSLTFNENEEGARFTLKEGGNVGIGTPNPIHTLEVRGSAAFDTRLGSFARGAVPGDGKWHNLISGLDEIQAFEVMARIRGRKGSGKYAISHAIALSAFGGKGSSPSIRVTSASYGGFFNKLQLRWSGEVNNYALQVRTRRHYGLNDQDGQPFMIHFHITRLWSEEDQDQINSNFFI